MASETKPERKDAKFQMLFTPSQLEAVNEWGWNRRIRTKAEAVRRLIDLGLQSAELLAALKHAIHWHDQLSPADIERFTAAVAKAEG